MNFNLFWIASMMMFVIGKKATISRSPQMEMKKIKEARIIAQKVDLNEYWPFPETLSEGDPFVIELEEKLMDMSRRSL
ncbi:hypothetical protein [Ekhidna sp. To15]|uniref:hypothetical protein n=1 Tax=Ekhidna sp. To15 TaxID=3395267 RepID=UPI003F51F1A4